MTRQMFSYDCDTIRKLAYDKRKDLLNNEDSKRFELHVNDCKSCADHLNRTEGMLSAARQIDYSAGINPNDLFSSIMSSVELNEEIPFTPNVVLADEHFEDDIPATSPFLRYAGLAAAALLFFAVGGFVITQFSDSAPVKQAQKSKKDAVQIVVDKNPEKMPPSLLRDLVLQPSPKHAENLNIFGDAQAEWKISGRSAQHFELKEGSVLVEYVPKTRSSSLKLQTSNFTIEVLGTVFYASKESQIVGVVAGKIRLKTSDGQSIVLERGQEYIPGKGIQNSNPKLLLESEKFVDVQQHNARLSLVPEGKTKTKTPIAKLKKRDLRQEANLAISKGDYKVAAQILERMVRELPKSAPENATLQLDLARIYIRQLRQPRRAFIHLKGFTKQRPLDAATPSAQKEMCRISKQLNLNDREACQE